LSLSFPFPFPTDPVSPTTGKLPALDPGGEKAAELGVYCDATELDNMVWVMGMSRGAGVDLMLATGDADGEVEDEDRDNDERSAGRTFGLGEGGRAEADPRDPMLTGGVAALSADEMFMDGVLLFRVFGSELPDGMGATNPRDRLSCTDLSTLSSPIASKDSSAAASFSLGPFLGLLEGC